MIGSQYQILVVGGGIQGCAIALSCARAGFSTLLIESNTWGTATSSRSSKLIHGGLRYLQTAQFGLVRECLQEREWMLEHMPDLVRRNWLYIPIYRTSHYRPWEIHAGLLLYFALSGFSRNGTYKRIPKERWSMLAGINQQDLQAVYAYQDAQTDDLELTQNIQKQAESAGATCLEQTRLQRADWQGSFYDVDIQVADEMAQVRAEYLINAGGPWISDVIEKVSPPPARVNVELVQGTHIVVDGKISSKCFYLEAPSDHRAVFVLPWKGQTLIGTTETPFDGRPEDCEPLQSEIDYLLGTVRHHFPDYEFKITEQWSGLRVLPKTSDRAFARPRDVMLKVEDSILSVYGGKLTAWRSTAASVLKHVQARFA